MNALFFILPLFLFSFGFAFAEPLSDIQTSVLNYDGNVASVNLSWNHDADVTEYEVGCVSCIPHIVKDTTLDELTLDGVIPLPNGSSLVLYVIAYDSTNEILTAKQVIIQLN